MDGKTYINEGVPLNSTGAANIILNTSKSTKYNTPDSTVIHVKTEKPSDLGVHINTTFSIASSKKIKLLFILNFLLSVICMVISGSVAFYYWNEIISMRRQLDTIKDHYMREEHTFSQDKLVQSALVSPPRPGVRQSRMDPQVSDEVAQKAKRYFVEDLGEDMLLVDSKKKNSSVSIPAHGLTILNKELVFIHFNGAVRELNLGKQSVIGPWVLDTAISSKQSEDFIALTDNYFSVKEAGLYLLYAQVVYFTKAPNCYFIWARQPGQEPRMLATCSTGDDNSSRSLDKSQISCSVQTVARLYKGDIVNFAQREQNRTVWLRPGYSFIGFIKLSS